MSPPSPEPPEPVLPYLEAGQPGRPALLFLHGGGLSSRQWAPQLEQLAQDFHCLAPDLPEQGRSAHVRPFTLEGSARAVSELVRTRVPGGRAHVVGLSLGGAVGLTLMLTAPERVESLLVSGTASGLGRVLGTVSLWSAGLYRLMSPERLAALSARQFGIPEEFAEAFREDLARCATADFTRSFTRALMGLRLPLEARVPILVAVGEHETWAAHRAARVLARRLPDARAVTVPGVGHVWNLQAPALFSATVRAWVRGEALPISE